MSAIESVERSSKAAYSRIHDRLNDLRELSASNLALRRLIKRNMKREA